MIVRDFDPDDIDGEDEDWGEDPDDETITCPQCREPVYDDAELCPYCGLYLSREDAPYRKPWWLVLGVLVCLMMMFWWILHP